MAYRNIRMGLGMRLIYFLLRVMSWLGQLIFYRKRTFIGRENLLFDGPAIVVTNHPCTLMDVLNIGVQVRQELYFLANYGLFKHPVSNWLLRHLYCIPIKRKEDMPEGVTYNNQEAFEQCFRHFEQYGLLFIAPEGTSWMDRMVYPFKSGTARIAFGAAARHDWALELKILPVGLTYTAPNLFRSEVIVHFGELIRLDHWREKYRENPEQAIDLLTAHLERQVKSQCVHVPDLSCDEALKIEETLLLHASPLPPQQAYERSRALASRLAKSTAKQADLLEYKTLLLQADIPERAVQAVVKPLSGLAQAGLVAGLVLGLPLFLAGYLCWLLPCFLPWWVAKRLNLYIGYDSTVKFLIGLLTFPLWIWLYWHLSQYLSDSYWVRIAIMAGILVLGYGAEIYQGLAKQWWAGYRGRSFARAQPQAFEKLLKKRNEILNWAAQ